jgi:hypothetical protein
LKSGGAEFDYLLQWQIEGSNDGNTWKSLDSRSTNDLYGIWIVKTYACSAVNPNEFFRFIRIRQTGRNSHNNDFFNLCNIEFFGKLKNFKIS